MQWLTSLLAHLSFLDHGRTSTGRATWANNHDCRWKEGYGLNLWRWSECPSFLYYSRAFLFRSSFFLSSWLTLLGWGQTSGEAGGGETNRNRWAAGDKDTASFIPSSLAWLIAPILDYGPWSASFFPVPWICFCFDRLFGSLPSSSTGGRAATIKPKKGQKRKHQKKTMSAGAPFAFSSPVWFHWLLLTKNGRKPRSVSFFPFLFTPTRWMDTYFRRTTYIYLSST